MTKATSRTTTPSEPDRYGDLDGAISDVSGMADITLGIFQGAFGIKTGPVTIDAVSNERLSFAVHHLHALISRLCQQYTENSTEINTRTRF
jgi:hypothetical protein